MVQSRVRPLCHDGRHNGKTLRVAIGVVVVALVWCREVRAIVLCGCNPGVGSLMLVVSVRGFGLSATVETQPEEAKEDEEGQQTYASC